MRRKAASIGPRSGVSCVSEANISRITILMCGGDNSLKTVIGAEGHEAGAGDGGLVGSVYRHVYVTGHRGGVKSGACAVLNEALIKTLLNYSK